MPEWPGAHVWFGDERAVPPDDERSNYRLVRETLLDRLRLQPEVHRIHGELGAAEAAALYDRELDGVTLDLALNGIGSDGHTASLFPNAPALDERERRAVAAEPALEPFVERVTLTPPVFAAARLLVYLVTGESKAEAVRRAFAEEPSADTPASLIRGVETIAILDVRPQPRVLLTQLVFQKHKVSSRVAARAGAVRDERAEAMAVAGDEAVGRARRAPDRPVAADDVRALVAGRLRKLREQRLRGGVVERQPAVPAAVESRGDTRHEAAEASVAVVEDDRTPHGSSSDSSSAAMPRRPASAWSTSTVSATGMSSRYSSRVSNDSSTVSTAST